MVVQPNEQRQKVQRSRKPSQTPLNQVKLVKTQKNPVKTQ